MNELAVTEKDTLSFAALGIYLSIAAFGICAFVHLEFGIWHCSIAALQHLSLQHLRHILCVRDRQESEQLCNAAADAEDGDPTDQASAIPMSKQPNTTALH